MAKGECMLFAVVSSFPKDSSKYHHCLFLCLLLAQLLIKHQYSDTDI